MYWIFMPTKNWSCSLDVEHASRTKWVLGLDWFVVTFSYLSGIQSAWIRNWYYWGMGQCVETLKTTRVDRAQGFGITEAADIFVAIVLDKWKLLDKASQLLRQAYINECTGEDYMACNNWVDTRVVPKEYRLLINRKYKRFYILFVQNKTSILI